MSTITLRFLLSLFLVSVMHSAFAQVPVTGSMECDFFDSLRVFKRDGSKSDGYKKITSDFSLRSDLLQKLESYVIVFKDFYIAPMYLEKEADSRACTTYVSEFKKEFALSHDIQKAREAVQKEKTINVLDIILDLTDLNKDDNRSTKKYLAEFKNPFTLEHIYFYLNTAYFDSTGQNPLYKLPQIIKEDNLKLLASRIDLLDHTKYVYYESYNSKAHFVKGFEMYHDNDVLAFGSGINQDRELTGGFKFTLTTDYFKWRWLRVRNDNESRVLTYQTISVIGVGYTPYIRYQNNFTLADSLHKYDRPFSSFLCFERAKYRTWRSGLIRHRGEFQVGTLGISQGRKIQAQLHEDVIHSSQFVHGWDNQIANEGRLVIQLNHKVDLLLWSTTNRYRSIFHPFLFSVDEPTNTCGKFRRWIFKKWCNQNVNRPKYCGFNFIGELDGRIGTIMTTIGGGVRLSTLDFLRQSGNHMIASKPHSNDDFGLKFDIGFTYRYVVHNSLLEGLGLFEPFPEDKYDKVAEDNYVLRGDEIERNLFIVDWGISWKYRKTTVFYRQTYHTLEYRSRLANVDFQNTNFTGNVDPADVQFYNEKIVREQNEFLSHKMFGKTMYGYGTIGISWVIE